jgi:hypothetical protein
MKNISKDAKAMKNKNDKRTCFKESGIQKLLFVEEEITASCLSGKIIVIIKNLNIKS